MMGKASLNHLEVLEIIELEWMLTYHSIDLMLSPFSQVNYVYREAALAWASPAKRFPASQCPITQFTKPEFMGLVKCMLLTAQGAEDE